MIETREISALTRFALGTLTRQQKGDMETLAHAAAQSDGTPLKDGWLLNVEAGHWQRDVPDPPEETPPDPPNGNGERSLGLMNSILDEIERKPG